MGLYVVHWLPRSSMVTESYILVPVVRGYGMQMLATVAVLLSPPAVQVCWISKMDSGVFLLRNITSEYGYWLRSP